MCKKIEYKKILIFSFLVAGYLFLQFSMLTLTKAFTRGEILTDRAKLLEVPGFFMQRFSWASWFLGASKFVNTGCLIWIVTKVNEYCGYVFGVRHFSFQIYAGNMCAF